MVLVAHRNAIVCRMEAIGFRADRLAKERDMAISASSCGVVRLEDGG